MRFRSNSMHSNAKHVPTLVANTKCHAAGQFAKLVEPMKRSNEILSSTVVAAWALVLTCHGVIVSLTFKQNVKLAGNPKMVAQIMVG